MIRRQARSLSIVACSILITSVGFGCVGEIYRMSGLILPVDGVAGALCFLPQPNLFGPGVNLNAAIERYFSQKRPTRITLEHHTISEKE